VGGRAAPAWREYLDAILYVLRTDVRGGTLPHDCTMGWSAAHEHFVRWCRVGTWTTATLGRRTQQWLNQPRWQPQAISKNCRRLDRHYEVTRAAHEGLRVLAVVFCLAFTPRLVAVFGVAVVIEPVGDCCAGHGVVAARQGGGGAILVVLLRDLLGRLFVLFLDLGLLGQRSVLLLLSTLLLRLLLFTSHDPRSSDVWEFPDVLEDCPEV
jgi:transposase